MLAAQTVTKAEFRSSQTHEFEAIKKIIPVVQAKGIYSCTICRGSLCTSSLLTYTVISFRTQCGRSGTRLVPKIKTGFYSRTYKILLTLGMVRN